MNWEDCTSWDEVVAHVLALGDLAPDLVEGECGREHSRELFWHRGKVRLFDGRTLDAFILKDWESSGEHNETIFYISGKWVPQEILGSELAKTIFGDGEHPAGYRYHVFTACPDDIHQDEMFEFGPFAPVKFDEHLGSRRSPKWGIMDKKGRMVFDGKGNIFAFARKKEAQEWIAQGLSLVGAPETAITLEYPFDSTRINEKDAARIRG